MTEQMREAYTFFQQNGFLPVDKKAYTELKDFKGESTLAEMSATVAVVWSHSFYDLYKIIHGYLCTVWFFDGMPVYFEINQPRGTVEYSLSQIIDVLYGLSMEAGLPFLQVYAIEERFLKEYEAVEGYDIKTEYSDDHSEYVYRTKDILELSGGINLNKRNRLKKFFDKENISICNITKENVHICLEIEKDWCLHKECSDCEVFAGCEKKSLEIMVDIFDDAVHNGIIGYIDGVPVGYAICEKKNDKFSFLFFGKSTVQDFFVYVVYMAVKMKLADVEYMNMNEDMGSMGLRMFKKHLSAHELWKKYLCTFTKLSKQG